MGVTEVIQICQIDGQTVTACRQVPVKAIFDSFHPSLAEMMPVLMACGGLMALGWLIKHLVRFIAGVKP